MLNFGSKIFKMLEFSPGIDLLLSESQHFWFSKNAFSELDLKQFSACAVYRTPKFWHKIQDSKKSVDMMLTKFKLGVGESFLHVLTTLESL